MCIDCNSCVGSGKGCIDSCTHEGHLCPPNCPDRKPCPQCNGTGKGTSPEEVIRAIEQEMCSRCRGSVREKCRAQKEGARNASMIVCITDGPFDYCDEEFFTEVPIPGDPRFKREEVV